MEGRNTWTCYWDSNWANVLMYVDSLFLLLIYGFSAISLLVSVYALWTLKEVEQHFKTKLKIKKNLTQTKPIIKVQRPKGHWD